MLAKVVCKRCRLSSLWTEEPAQFLESVCPVGALCEAEITGGKLCASRAESSAAGAGAVTPEPRYERLSALDSAFLFFEGPATPMNIGLTATFAAAPLRRRDGRVDVGRIKGHVASRLHLTPRYRQRLAWVPFSGQPIWIDDPLFRLDDHVRYVKLPARRGRLKDLAGRILAKPLDRNRPLWEMWLVDGLPGDRFAMVTKVHHCMIDGVSGAELVGLLLSPAPEDAVEEPVPWTPRPGPSETRLVSDELGRLRALPQGALSALTGVPSLQGAREVLRTARSLVRMLSSVIRPASPTRLNRPIGPRRRFDWTSIDLDEIRDIKTRLGSTVNDVALAVVAGAVRRFDKTLGNGSGEFRVAVPVSVRAPSERGTLGNRVSIWMMPLPVDEADPLARLAKVRAATEDRKASNEAAILDAMLDVADEAGPPVMKLGAKLLSWLRPFNLLVTNVPGPQFPLYLLGSRMLEAYPEVPLFYEQGLGIALFGYAGKLYWGFNAAPEALPDVSTFTRAVQSAFRELRAAAGVKSSVAARVAG